MLSPEQQLRYARHTSLNGFGLEAQEKLLGASVLLIGAGGLGSPAAFYLAAAGVGRIGIVDEDVVDRSNLQRQILHRDEDVGIPKVESAKRALLALNPDSQVDALQLRFDETNARELVRQYDLVIDGSDNFPTRYLINDACVLEQRPLVHGSIQHFEGQVTVFSSPQGPCYRCLFPAPPAPGTVPSCAEAGVLGILPGVVGTLQATEAIKLLTGIGEPLIGRLLMYDALSMDTRIFKLQPDAACPVCGPNPSITEAKNLTWNCERDLSDMNEITVIEYIEYRADGIDHLLLDVRNPDEIAAGAIEGHLNIPLAELPSRVQDLAEWQERPIICSCKSGVRSAQAIRILKQAGFADLTNLAGGYLAWLKK